MWLLERNARPRDVGVGKASTELVHLVVTDCRRKTTVMDFHSLYDMKGKPLFAGPLRDPANRVPHPGAPMKHW